MPSIVMAVPAMEAVELLEYSVPQRAWSFEVSGTLKPVAVRDSTVATNSTVRRVLSAFIRVPPRRGEPQHPRP